MEVTMATMYAHINSLFNKIRKAGFYPIFYSQTDEIAVWSSQAREELLYTLKYTTKDLFDIVDHSSKNTLQGVDVKDVIAFISQDIDHSDIENRTTQDCLDQVYVKAYYTVPKQPELKGTIKRKKNIDIDDVFDEE